MKSTDDSKLFDSAFVAKLERLYLIAKHTAAKPAPSMRRSRLIGDGLEFADHRAYAEGDDLRFLDWAYYARMERLLLRMFHQHSEAEVAVLLDNSGSMNADRFDNTPERKFDYARKATAAIAYLAMGSHDRVSIHPFAETLQTPLHTGRNRQRIFQALRFLEALRCKGKTDLFKCVQRFANSEASPTTVLIVSDLLDCDEMLDDALSHLRMHKHEAIVLHTCGSSDANPNPGETVTLQDSERDERIRLRITKDVLERYKKEWNRFIEKNRDICARHKAVYIEAPSNLPFEQLILQTLRRAGVLAG